MTTLERNNASRVLIYVGIFMNAGSFVLNTATGKWLWAHVAMAGLASLTHSLKLNTKTRKMIEEREGTPIHYFQEWR